MARVAGTTRLNSQTGGNVWLYCVCYRLLTPASWYDAKTIPKASSSESA